MLALYIGIILASSYVVWKGSDLLEVSSQRLADHYSLPPVVQGSIITAIGSSFPELSTAVISTLIHGEFGLGISAIVGSAIFNILVIPALSCIVAGRLETDKIMVYKDAQFYITSVAVLLLAFSMAVIYHPVEGETLKGHMTRSIAIVPVLLYLLYIFLQQQEMRDYRKNKEDLREKSPAVWKEWGQLLLGLALIVASVEGLVRGAIFLGDFFNTPSFLWGVTVVAAATSIPDALVSIKVARSEKGTVSLANVLGSNVFDLLVAVPAGVLIAGSSVVDFAVAVPMMLFLTFATIILFTFLRTYLTLSKTEGWILLACYLVFILWMFLESFGVLSFLVS